MINIAATNEIFADQHVRATKITQQNLVRLIPRYTKGPLNQSITYTRACVSVKAT